MNTLEGKAWTALAAVHGIGPKGLWRIADYLAGHGKTASWLVDRPDKMKSILPAEAANLVMTDFSKIKTISVDQCDNSQVTVLHPLHPAFPEQIRLLKDKTSLPALLYVWGNIGILKRPAIAVVGKRNAGARALAIADALASELAAKGINLASGYASGIDATAHLAALRAGGTTSIILAEGIHRFQKKPELRVWLTEENTLVISQFEPGAKWAAFMAMTRNKLVGALSQALMVIVSGPERDVCGRNSGTFNAAISAQKIGIPVFVVAPSFFSDQPAGNSGLIAQGCHAWDPASGAGPILAVIERTNKINDQKQLSLFGKNGG